MLFPKFIKGVLSSIFIRILSIFYNNYKSTKILHKSKNFLIINKAYDLKINSNNKYEPTVQTFLKENLPSLASNNLHHEFYFMHRLDYSTSGLMCVPVHKEACQLASKAIQERQCKKYYIALVQGYLSLKILDLNFPIGRDNKVTEIEKMCVSNDHTARNARTLMLAIQVGTFDGYPTTKVILRPITGRRHQIRVHCSHIGHTIVGDYTYSNKKHVKPKRMYLHSLRLFIPNKIEDINIQTEDPFTDKFVDQWKVFSTICNLTEAFERIDKLLNC